MEIWFLKDMHRLSRERQALSDLQEAEAWLIDLRWFIDHSTLGVDVLLRAHEHDYDIRMLYPDLFPNVPPIVRSVDPNAHWSSHQYGDGTLCLEWGQDTWHPEVTGADMLRSAFKLLEVENPLGTGQHGLVYSRHQLSVGQELRTSYGRLYVGKQLADYLASLPSGSHGQFEFVIRRQSKSILVLLQTIQPTALSGWQDAVTPEHMYMSVAKNGAMSGLFLKADFVGPGLNIDTVSEMEETLKGAECGEVLLQTLREAIGSDSRQGFFGVLLVDRENRTHLFLLLDGDNHTVFPMASVVSEEGTVQRIPENLQKLSAKSVAIVGLGSVGSKIALSLGRSGISAFVLVDEDMFLPENVCRHDLDWRNVGEHKVDAIAEKLAYVCSNPQIEVSRLRLTGQESNSALSIALSKLGQCDMIIDATADPQVFNLMVAAAMQYGIPLVWCEVYAGGIGGMIARSRPGLDPDPYVMRAMYHQFCRQNDVPALSASGEYAAQGEDGKTWIATDGDVSVIAGHVVRLGIDTILAREPSAFPHSMYLIGLMKSWLFGAPFDTIPLETGHLSPWRLDGSLDGNPPENEVAFLRSLLEDV